MSALALPMNGWLIFLLLLTAYVGLVVWLRGRQGKLSGGFELNGPFIMWRTQWGKRWLEKIARPSRFWNAVADAGVVLTFAMGAMVFVIVAYLAYLQIQVSFQQPALVAANAVPPNFLLGIPGVNPIIPIGYGLVAILFALVIHEGSHGVISYASKMRVKALGLLFFVVPVGAFVEPNEEDLERSSTRAKNRVFAAGPTSNIVLAIVAGTLLSTLFLGAMVPRTSEGVLVSTIEPDSAAFNASFRPGDRVLAIEFQNVTSRDSFSQALDASFVGQQIRIDYVRDGKANHTEAVLGDRHAYYEKLGVTNRSVLNSSVGKGFLGMSVLGGSDVHTAIVVPLEHPFASWSNFKLYNLYPIFVFSTGVDAFAPPYRELLDVTGPLAALPPAVFFGLASALYWIVWINITLATFNALPMGPLDGGQMFRATLRERLMRRYGVDREKVHVEKAELGGLKLTGRDEDTQVKLDKIQHVVKRTTWTLGFGILGLILIPILVPHVLKLFY